MITAELFFQVFGVLFLAVGMAFLWQPTHYKKMLKKLLKDETFIYAGGLASLFIGVVMLHFHSAVTLDIMLILTLLAAGACAKGIFLLWHPKGAVALLQVVLNNKNALTIIGVFSVLLGALLAFIGYGLYFVSF